MAPVMTGSHIDTVRTGGRYDGNLGVLAGLEVVATLDAAGVVKRPARSNPEKAVPRKERKARAEAAAKA